MSEQTRKWRFSSRFAKLKTHQTNMGGNYAIILSLFLWMACPLFKAFQRTVTVDRKCIMFGSQILSVNSSSRFID